MIHLEESAINDAISFIFISSNSWDVAGAKSFGFNVAWINRGNNKKEIMPFECDVELSSLLDIYEII